MAIDLNEFLHTAAAKPSREAPLTVIETRLRRRRRLRRGGVGLCALTLVAALGGGVALTTNDGPSIGTLQHAAASVTGGDPPLSVELPEGWVESPIEPGLRHEQEVLTVGTALQPTGTPHAECLADESYQDDVFVQLGEFTKIVVLTHAITPASQKLEVAFPPRPDDFANAPAAGSTCFPSADPTSGWSVIPITFQDNGRMFDARVSFGPTSSVERQAQAFAVLNSLIVVPITLTPEPVATSVPTGTAPESADTAAIAAAVETWIASKPPNFDGADAVIEDWASIKETAQIAAELVGNPQCYTGHVDAITRIDEDDADVIFSFFCDGQPAIPSNEQGRAVKVDGVWKVSRETVCAAFAIGQARCPPRE